MNESIEYAILNDNYKPTQEQIKGMAKELWDLKENHKPKMKQKKWIGCGNIKVENYIFL